MNKKQIIGVIIFVILILGIILYKKFGNEVLDSNLTTVYVATGGGKEDFLGDEEVIKILRSKYKLNVVFDTWSNGTTITWPLIREKISLGNESIINKLKTDNTIGIHTEGVSKYDALFTSDQRFYDYYKLSPKKDRSLFWPLIVVLFPAPFLFRWFGSPRWD